MIMSSYASPHTAAPPLAGQSWANSSLVILRRWWTAYIDWRMEQAAIAQLGRMNDRALKDIGVTRSEIPHRVRQRPA
jgi:uncharacterized protein YjiS (DUF1127 family)